MAFPVVRVGGWRDTIPYDDEHPYLCRVLEAASKGNTTDIFYLLVAGVGCEGITLRDNEHFDAADRSHENLATVRSVR